MFHIIGFIIFGLIVGLSARAILPGRDSMSIPMTMILGVVGSVIAGWLGRVLGLYGPDDGAGFIMSTIGAIVVLAIYNRVVKNRRNVTSETRDFPRRVA
jgi:uncharacterized membrane protein YeaQ/YmgE (transglycosylase-associated protein family)